MDDPWNVRPVPRRGDTSPYPIWVAVGEALSHWERLESNLADIYAALFREQRNAALFSYREIDSSSLRTKMLRSSIKANCATNQALRDKLDDFAFRFSKFSARRNELAHGTVIQLAYGNWQLCPLGIKTYKWTDEGKAKFQYSSLEVRHYCKEFFCLVLESQDLFKEIEKDMSPMVFGHAIPPFQTNLSDFLSKVDAAIPESPTSEPMPTDAYTPPDPGT